MGKRKYEIDVTKLREFVAEGHSRQEACEAFCVPYALVVRTCKGIDVLEKRNEALKAYKAEGHTMQEVADYFGLTRHAVAKVCRNIAPQLPRNYRNQWNGSDIEERGREYVERHAPDFEYAGGYKGWDTPFYVRCKACGHIEKRSPITIRKKKIRCEACYQRELNETQKEREKRKEKKKEQRLKAREDKAQAKAWERYERSIHQQAFGICKECGALFIPRAKGERYCSPECRQSAWYNHNDRRLKGVRKDSGITLHKVYERDGGRCYLCGGLCDWEDYGEKGAGNKYPSVDHVVPLALNGTHTWDNVRLAHRICNSLKRDNPLPKKMVAT